MPYAVKFDSIQYPGRKAENPVITTLAGNAEEAQENVIDFLVGMGAVPGNIVSITKVGSIPQTGIMPVAIACNDKN